MSEYAMPYNSKGGDRKYNADDFSDWLKNFFTDGIVGDGFHVRANSDMSFTIEPGVALIGGKTKNFPQKTTVTLQTASGSLNRIDNIVIRRDDDKRDFEIAVRTGAAAATPKAPAPVRAGTIYELVIAQVEVKKGVVTITQASVSDTRADRKLCGWVMGTTDHIKPELLLEQIWTQWEEWFNKMKNQLGTDAAGNLQQQVNVLKEMVSSGTTLPPLGKREGEVFILYEK